MRAGHTGLAARLAAPVAVVALAGCSAFGGDGPPTSTPVEEPGPTLASGPLPADWVDIPGPGGLLYSVPSDWEPFAQPSADGGTPDDSQDWGSGYVTRANTIADPGYCPLAGTSFRVLVGITEPIVGDPHEQAVSASHSLADSLQTRFTQAGADVPEPEPVKIGVSGAPAWHVSLRGTVHPPRNICTPPTIRIDAIAVSTRARDGSPAAQLFVLMADEGEEGVQPEDTVDEVVASLRFDNSI